MKIHTISQSLIIKNHTIKRSIMKSHITWSHTTRIHIMWTAMRPLIFPMNIQNQIFVPLLSPSQLSTSSTNL